MDKEQMKQPPKPYEFRSKPAWQRLIIMLGGVLVNILLAIVIYIVMLYSWGEQYLPTAEVKYGITVDSLAYEMGGCVTATIFFRLIIKRLRIFIKYYPPLL